MTEQLKEALVEVAEQVPAARVPADLWSRGRRARRRARVAAVLSVAGVVLAIAALVPLWLPGPAPQRTGDSQDDAVPATLHQPWMWQATVEMDPRGPASVLFTGDGWGLHGTDVFDHEGKVAVVGRDGSYRMLLYSGDEVLPGEDVLLSPDGKRVAHGWVTGAPDGWVVITDLTTGRSEARRGPSGIRCCGQPVAWAPDGRSLLVIDYHRDNDSDVLTARLALLDLTTGSVRMLAELGDLFALRAASLAAFSPDGQRIVAAVGNELRLFDASGGTQWTVPLAAGRYLAGAGAFTPDGQRIVTVRVEGCLDDCDASALAARRWHFGYLDARTGKDTGGPAIAPVTAMAVRAVGWRQDTDLAALIYQPDFRHPKSLLAGASGTGFTETDHVTLVALHEGRAPEVLLDPPDEVLAMDVAQDLLRAGRFGGPAPEPAMFPARPVILVPIYLAALPVAGIVALIVGLSYNRRQARRRLRPPS